MSPSSGRWTLIPGTPKSAFVLSLALLHGMLLSCTASDQAWALQPGIVLQIGLFCIPKRKSAVRTDVSGQGSRTEGTYN